MLIVIFMFFAVLSADKMKKQAIIKFSPDWYHTPNSITKRKTLVDLAAPGGKNICCKS